MDTSQIQQSYDTVCDEYVLHIVDELQHKPLDRDLLREMAQWAGPHGVLCDLGCGPGHVATYLADLGAKVIGVDLSPKMVEAARRRNPSLAFHQGDMTQLDFAEGSWDGIVAFYSIVNIPREKLGIAFREMYRTLKPSGKLLLSFHIGTHTIHKEEWWTRSVNLEFYFFTVQEIRTALEEAGLKIEKIQQRSPYPDVEHPSERAYFLCQKP